MKHEQLVQALQLVGFQTDLYGLDLSGVVAELMGIKEADISWDWFDIYMNFLCKASQYEITGTGENLLPLAEACYVFLNDQLRMESERRVSH